jgi:hypothetical protein
LKETGLGLKTPDMYSVPCEGGRAYHTVDKPVSILTT